MAIPSDAGATGDIAIAVLRRKGDIAVPVYLWADPGTGARWVDFADLTAAQFSAWVDARLAAQASTQPPWVKAPNVTISRSNDW